MAWHSIELYRGIILQENVIFRLLENYLNKNKQQMDLVMSKIKEYLENGPGADKESEESDKESEESDKESDKESEESNKESDKKPKYTIDIEYKNTVFNLMKLKGYDIEDILNLCVLGKSNFVGGQRKTNIGFFRMGHCCNKNEEILLGYFINEISLIDTSKKSTEISSVKDIKKDNKLKSLCEKIGIKKIKLRTYIQASDCAYCT